MLHRLEPAGAGDRAGPHEQEVFDGIFAGRGSTVEMSELENEFYTKLPGIRTSLFERLLKQRLLPRPPGPGAARWTGGGIALGVLIGMPGAAPSPTSCS